ncbi:hypothetical protein KHP62_02005 [Rhodobacteraceae bacterium NNCM2]|nr:hypothetical protein [Coraliihabitans acroporae]
MWKMVAAAALCVALAACEDGPFVRKPVYDDEVWQGVGSGPAPAEEAALESVGEGEPVPGPVGANPGPIPDDPSEAAEEELEREE